jgi:RNA polymerase sigma factor (sigma-70 family)
MPLPPFQATLDEHRDTVARFLVAWVGPQDAEDALQETLISALRAYPRLRPGSNVRAWMLTIAKNKAMDFHRARVKRPVLVGDVPEMPDEDEIPERDEALWHAVRELPPKQQAAVTLRFVADLSHAEIGGVLDCSEAAARRSLHEGLTKLREEWA